MSDATRTIGVISDTHGLLRPQAVAALAGVDAIVHAGDIGAPEVLTALARIAPVTAVRGNNDRERWASRIPETATLDVAGARVYVIHDRHAPTWREQDGVLFVNPGSAGPRRFTLPVATARLRVAQGVVSGEIVLLDV